MLTLENFKSRAKENYIGGTGNSFTFVEFEEDFKRFKLIENTLKRNEVLTETLARMVLNQVIILHNCFGRFAVDGLFFVVSEEHWGKIKTLTKFLSILPVSYPQNDLEDDRDIVKFLRNI